MTTSRGRDRGEQRRIILKHSDLGENEEASGTEEQDKGDAAVHLIHLHVMHSSMAPSIVGAMTV